MMWLLVLSTFLNMVLLVGFCNQKNKADIFEQDALRARQFFFAGLQVESENFYGK